MGNPYVTGPVLPRHLCTRGGPHLPHIETSEGPEPEFLCDGIRPYPKENRVSDQQPVSPEDCPTPEFHWTHRYCPSCSWTVEDEPRDAVEEFNDAIVEEQNRLQEAAGAPEGSRDPQEQSVAPESGTQPQPEALFRGFQPGGNGSPIGQPVGQPAEDVVATLRYAMAAACMQHGQGEKVRYALIDSIAANQQNQMIPVLLLWVGIPGLVLGETAHAQAIVQSLTITPAEIDGMVADMLEQARQYRYQQAQQTTANQQPR